MSQVAHFSSAFTGCWLGLHLRGGYLGEKAVSSLWRLVEATQPQKTCRSVAGSSSSMPPLSHLPQWRNTVAYGMRFRRHPSIHLSPSHLHLLLWQSSWTNLLTLKSTMQASLRVRFSVIFAALPSRSYIANRMHEPIHLWTGHLDWMQCDCHINRISRRIFGIFDVWTRLAASGLSSFVLARFTLRSPFATGHIPNHTQLRRWMSRDGAWDRLKSSMDCF